MIPPVIIIGMHRSGTTLLASMLERLGMHLGWLLQENWEALFFVERNDKLMQICGASWESPAAVSNLLGHQELRNQAVALLRRDLHSVRFLSYLGPRHVRAVRAGCGPAIPWAWKDPRNSFLLPLWLELFPESRIIHVCRHPMDVARSLQAREGGRVRSRIDRLMGREGTEGDRAGSRDIRPNRGLLRAVRRWNALREVALPLREYEKLRVPATLSLTAGIHLWTQYVQQCCRHVRSMPDRSIAVKYEDFLLEPVAHLERLAEFCGVPTQRGNVEALCKRILPDRRFAYRQDPEASRGFEAFRDNELVREVGYHES